MRLTKIVLLTLVAFVTSVQAQETFPYNGVRPKEVTYTAFTHATLYVDYQTVLNDATLLVFNGRVVDAGVGIAVPANTVVHDCTGKTIYPSFVDIFSDYGMPKSQPEMRDWRRSQMESNRKGAFGWNQALRTDTKASLLFTPNDDAAKELRNIGFGSVVSQQMDGISRGTSCLVGLGANPNFNMIAPEVAANYSFSKGTSTQDYPSSLMGSIALLRQTYYDAMWYAQQGNTEEQNLTLKAWNETQSLPQIFDAGDKWNVLRADKIGDEFKTQYIIRAWGDEYQRIDDIKATKAPLIVGLGFPLTYDVTDPLNSRMISMAEMKHWELAPTNPGVIAKAGIVFALSSSSLTDKGDFLKNLRKAVLYGLSQTDALKALTYTPVSLIHAEKEIGALRKGLRANFFIADKNIFEEDATIQENWVGNEQYVISAPKNQLSGEYALQLPKHTYTLKVDGDPGKNSATYEMIKSVKNDDGTTKMDTVKVDVKMNADDQLLTLSFNADDEFYKGMVRLSGNVGEKWTGRGQSADGIWFDWTASKTAPAVASKKEDKKKTEAPTDLGKMIYPFTSYGVETMPQQETVLITNATIWTCEKEGKIENGQILISGGKIVAVGKTVDASKIAGVKTIDAKGKHVTPGIIDEHSHIALESVNEGAQTSSAEVEEARVVWPEDVDIYRQLAGGVTAAQLLHGSANAIGGQSAMVKLRWGVSADKMLIEGAAPFIKFALGENVTHMNAGFDATQRFPQTRMGVEQVYYDSFIRAREYGKEWKGFQTPTPTLSAKTKGKSAPTVKMPRRDLELEALNQILEHERFITCHSYVQREINMLMHVADSMHFTLNTFTHILEGYKVADKMKVHGANASTFSDWWAYKYEVKDAIPYNGALMWEQGITTAFNSDDAEMARRLNQEAAKAVKYGGVPEEEALKFVTYNPAKMLHLDKHMGSLAAGKDADVVIWSDNPLSIYAKAEKTFVDGICYFDIERDEQMRKTMEAERQRLIQKMLSSKSGGDKTQKPAFKHQHHFHCDTMDETGKGISNH